MTDRYQTVTYSDSLTLVYDTAQRCALSAQEAAAELNRLNAEVARLNVEIAGGELLAYEAQRFAPEHLKQMGGK